MSIVFLLSSGVSFELKKDNRHKKSYSLVNLDLVGLFFKATAQSIYFQDEVVSELIFQINDNGIAR